MSKLAQNSPFPQALPVSGVDASEWVLDTLFGPRKADAWIAAVQEPSNGAQWEGGRYSDLSTALRTAKGSGHYFSCVLVRAGETQRLNRTAESGVCIFFDDVGDMASNPDANIDKAWLDTFGLDPTFVVETSAGNFQYTYVFDAPITPVEQLALVRSFKADAHTHGGFKQGNDLVRYGRLPSGVNPKPTKGSFSTRLVAGSGRVYNVDELVAGFRIGKPDTKIVVLDADDDGHPRVLDVDTAVRFDLVERAVKAIINDLDRSEWIHMGHAIDGALEGDPWGESVFLEFSGRWTGGASDRAEDERAWRSLEGGRAGYGFLMKMLRKQNSAAAEAVLQEITRAQAKVAFPPFPAGATMTGRFRTLDTFIGEYKPVVDVIDGLVALGGLYTLTGVTGTGKTGWLTTTSLAVITGRRDILDRKVVKGRVAFSTAENPGGFRMRLAVGVQHFKVDPAAVGTDMMISDVRTSPEAIFADLKADADKHGPLSLVFIDTWQAFFDGKDSSSPTEALAFTIRFRALTRLPGGPAVVMATHPVKNAAPDQLIPYGGGSILNEVDGNLTLSRQPGGLVALGWQGKLRGLDFDPPVYQSDNRTAPGIVDVEGNPVKIPVLTTVTTAEAESREESAIDRDGQALEGLHANPRASLRGLAARTNMNHMVVKRALERLARAKPPLVRQELGKWFVTKAGEGAVKKLENSGPKV